LLMISFWASTMLTQFPDCKVMLIFLAIYINNYKIFSTFVFIMMNNTLLLTEGKAWIKRKDAPGEVVRVIPDMESNGRVTAYQLYTAFEHYPDYLGQILFDADGYWIYDGEVLSVGEQEQVARFILKGAG